MRDQGPQAERPQCVAGITADTGKGGWQGVRETDLVVEFIIEAIRVLSTHGAQELEEPPRGRKGGHDLRPEDRHSITLASEVRTSRDGNVASQVCRRASSQPAASDGSER